MRGSFVGGHYRVAHSLMDIVAWLIYWWTLARGSFIDGHYPVAHLLVDIIPWLIHWWTFSRGSARPGPRRPDPTRTNCRIPCENSRLARVPRIASARAVDARWTRGGRAVPMQPRKSCIPVDSWGVHFGRAGSGQAGPGRVEPHLRGSFIGGYYRVAH